MKISRKISYEEFLARLPRLLEEVARRDETLLFERDGKVYKVELEAEEATVALGGATMAEFDPTGRLRVVDPEVAREALRKSAGALKGVDIEKLKADLRIQRQQDSSGRPG